MDDPEKTDFEELKEGSEQVARDKKERIMNRQQAMDHNEDLHAQEGTIPRRRIWHSVDERFAKPSELARELAFRKFRDNDKKGEEEIVEQANFDEEVAEHAKSMDVALDKIKKYRVGEKVRLTNQRPNEPAGTRGEKPADTSTHFTRRTPLRPDETETHEERDDVEQLDETALDAIIEMGRDPEYRGRRGNYKDASMKKKGVVEGSDPDVSAKLSEHADDMEKRAKKLQEKKPEKEYKMHHTDYMNPDSDKRDTEKYGETAGKKRHDPPKKKRTVSDGGGGGGGVQLLNPDNAKRYGSGYMTMGGYEKESPGGTESELQFRMDQEKKKMPFNEWRRYRARDSYEVDDKNTTYEEEVKRRYNDYIKQEASKKVNPQNRKDGKPPKKDPPTGAALVKGEGFSGDEGDSDAKTHVKNETKERTNVGFMDGTGREATQAIDEEEDLEELTDGELSEVEKLKALTEELKGRAPIEAKDTLPKKEPLEDQDFESQKPRHRYHESRNRREAHSSGKSPTGVGAEDPYDKRLIENVTEPITTEQKEEKPAPKGSSEPYDISNTKRLDRRRESMRTGNPKKNRSRKIRELIDANPKVTSGVKDLESTPHTKEIQEAGRDARKKRRQELRERFEDLTSQLERMEKRPRKKRTGNVPKPPKSSDRKDGDDSAPTPTVRRRKKSTDDIYDDKSDRMQDWISRQTEKFKTKYPDWDEETIKKKVRTSWKNRQGTIKNRPERVESKEKLPETSDVKDIDDTVRGEKQYKDRNEGHLGYETWSNSKVGEDESDWGKNTFKPENRHQAKKALRKAMEEIVFLNDGIIEAQKKQKKKDSEQTKFKTEEEIRKEKHEAAKKRKKQVWDKARKDGVGRAWFEKADKKKKPKLTEGGRKVLQEATTVADLYKVDLRAKEIKLKAIMIKLKRGETLDRERVQHTSGKVGTTNRGLSPTKLTESMQDRHSNFRAPATGNAPFGSGTAGTAERKKKPMDFKDSKQTSAGQGRSVRAMNVMSDKEKKPEQNTGVVGDPQSKMGLIQSDSDKEDKEMKFGELKKKPKTDKRGKPKKDRLAGAKEKLGKQKEKLGRAGSKLNDKFFEAVWGDRKEKPQGDTKAPFKKPPPRAERKRQPKSTRSGEEVYSGTAATKPDYSQRKEDHRNPSQIWRENLLNMKREADENRKGSIKETPIPKGKRKPGDKPEDKPSPKTGKRPGVPKGKRKRQGVGTKFFHGGKIKS